MKNPTLPGREERSEANETFPHLLATAVAWPPVRSHVAILRGSHRPDALVLRTLFPPKAQPGETRARSRYYLATVGQILGADPALVGAIEADLNCFPGHSLGLIINEPLPVPADWGDRPEHFKAWRTTLDGVMQTAEQQRAEQERHCRDWAIGAPRARRPKQWGAGTEHIGLCRCLFAECDREGFDLADQLALAWRVFGAAPSFTIATGGKSLHVHFRLAGPITPERFTEFQRLVIAPYRHLAPECSINARLAKAAQVPRLAGGVNPRTGNLATIRSASGTTVDPGALEAALAPEKALWAEVA